MEFGLRGLLDLIEADSERGLEVVPRVRAERDVGLGVEHTGHFVQPTRDHVRHLVELAHPDHGDEVDVPGHRVDLADPVQVRDRLRYLGDAVGGRGNHHDRGDHAATLPSRGFQLFTEPLLFNSGSSSYQGGSLRQSQTVAMYVYENAFTKFDFGYASAVAWVLFLVILLAAAANHLAVRRLGGSPMPD